ncbi:MAG: prolyl oligopeptidase family serine peptidase, partial [Nitrolancea sp.]
VHSLVNVDTGQTHELVREESEKGLKGELPPVVRPGGAGIAYVLTPENWPHVFYYDLASNALRQLTDADCDDTGHAGDGLQFSPDGSKLVFSSSRETELNQRQLWSVDIDTDNIVRMTTIPGTDSCAAWSPDGRSIAYLHCSPDQSADIWLIDVAEMGSARQITRSMPESLTPDKTTLPRHLTFPSADGLQIHGDIFLPKGFDSSRRYPAVVWVHGGMSRQMRFGWHPMHSYSLFYSFNQYLLHRGFIVLSVDYRGSIGYGRDYEEATYLSMCQGDLADVVAGAAYLKSLDYVDSDAVGVYGLSYGGYMTLGAMTKHPDAFAVGVNIAGIWDWPQYERWRDETYPGSRWQGTQRLGGMPTTENADVWHEASPLHFVEGLRNPLLNLMGTEDERVDFTQMDSIIRDCVAHEKDFAVLYYPGETHTFTHRRTWKDAFPRIEGAFRRYLTVPPDQRPPAMI